MEIKQIKQIKKETITEKVYYSLFKKECVYFVRDITLNMIKIGYTSSLERRMREILWGSGVCSERELLRVIHGTRITEQKLHKQFKEYRWTGGKKREWFHCFEELMDFIGSLSMDTELTKSKVKVKVKECQNDSDYLGQYLEEKGLVVNGVLMAYRETCPEFHKLFRTWQIESGLSPYTPFRIGKEMKQKGYYVRKLSRIKCYVKEVDEKIKA